MGGSREAEVSNDNNYSLSRECCSAPLGLVDTVRESSISRRAGTANWGWSALESVYMSSVDPPGLSLSHRIFRIRHSSQANVNLDLFPNLLLVVCSGFGALPLLRFPLSAFCGKNGPSSASTRSGRGALEAHIGTQDHGLDGIPVFTAPVELPAQKRDK